MRLSRRDPVDRELGRGRRARPRSSSGPSPHQEGQSDPARRQGGRVQSQLPSLPSHETGQSSLQAGVTSANYSDQLHCYKTR